MEFDLVKKIKELEKTYTKESVGKFLDEYMNNVRYQGENSFNAFLNKTKVLVKKAGYVDENGTPYYPISYETFENLEKDGFLLNNKEKVEFEVLMAYLIVEKGNSEEKVREMNHRVGEYAKEKNISFMGAYKKVRSLKDEKTQARLKEIFEHYEEDWEETDFYE